MKKSYDVIIIGGGPAGLFAAHEISLKSSMSVCVVDKGLAPLERKKSLEEKKMVTKGVSTIMSGIGGAGLFSDGKLNFTYKIGKTDLTEFMSASQANNLIKETEEIFNRFNMDGQVYPSDMSRAKKIKEVSLKNDINLMLIKQKHLGSDMLPSYINDMMVFLSHAGVDFKTYAEVDEILLDKKANSVTGVKVKDINLGHVYEIKTKNIISAPGRVGSKWFYREAQKIGLEVNFRAVEVGVRVETNYEVMKSVTNTIYDPTFFIRTESYEDEVRTFCTNERGYVAKENYDDFICVNGHALKNKKSANTNFAFLSKIDLTGPITDTYKYGRSIGKLATTIGGGLPLIQRFGDLKRGKRSTWNRIDKSFVTPTLKEATPGDISMALPARIMTNIIEGLEKLDSVVSGVASDATLLYAPEIKFFSTQIKSDNMLRTSIKGLSIAGDGTGVAGNIVGATATGIIAARGLLEK